MKVIILAAGKGTRLMPLTRNKPKCMVELNEKPLLEYQLDLFAKFNITDLTVVAGYQEEKINYKQIKKIINPDYDSTNMVSTLFCAHRLFDGKDDILISYGDIIYNEDVLKSIIESDEDISVVIDKDWKAYWSERMQNPLEDAETLKINKAGYIEELGKKPTTYDEIQGQYIGLIKIKKEVSIKIKDYYENLDKAGTYDGNNYLNMYMTSFLQMLANDGYNLYPVYIRNGWMEVDQASDLNYSKFLKTEMKS